MPALISQRVAVLEVWRTFEEQHGTSDDVARVEAMKPIISKRRRVDQENGQMVEGNTCVISIPLLLMDSFRSEHVFVFPDDEKENNPTSFKFLQIAHAWKEAQKKKEAESSSLSLAVPSAKDSGLAKDDDDDGGSNTDDDQSSGDES